MTRSLITCISLLLILAHTSYGQGHLFLEHYGPSDGLNASTVWKGLKDDQGFLWMATDDGLVRYDGLEFKVFRSKIEDTTGFDHGNVFDLIKDYRGQLLAVAKNGLVRFDPATHILRRIPFRPENFRTSIVNVPRLLALGEDPHHNLWICSSYGIFILNEKDEFVKYIRIEDETLVNQFNHCRGVTFDDLDCAWIATEAGVVRIHCRDYSITKWPLMDNGGLHRAIHHSEGKVWAYGEQLYCFDAQNPFPDVIPNSGLGGFIFSISENPRQKGQLWLSNRSGGVSMFDSKSASFSEFKMHREDKSDDLVYATHVFFDEEAMWIASHQGLYRTVLADDQIHTVVLSETTGVQDHAIYNIFPDNFPDTQDWSMVTTSDGLYRCNFKTGEYRKLPFPRDTQGNEISGLNHRFQNAEDDNFWSVGWKGLYRCKNDACKLIIADSVVEPGKRDWRWLISSVQRDSKGRFWIAAESKLALLDGDQITFYAPPAITDHSGDTLMAKPSFNRFLFDKDENIWLVSDFSSQKHVIAMYKFDVQTRQFEAFHHTGNKDFPNVENIFSHALIGDELWCATASGILRFNPYLSTPVFDLVTYEDWLPTSSSGTIVAGPRGEAWITTKLGLIRWRSDSNVRIFKRTDGFFEDNPGRMRSARDGAIYLFNDTYVTWFHPDSLRATRKVLQPFLTGILVNSMPYMSAQSTSYLSEIYLRYNENSIALNFSALDFAKTKNVMYAYTIEGAGEGWIETGKNSAVTLSGLSGGDYIFKVRARYSDEDWSEKILTLRISIATAWYKSWWFYVLIALTLATIIYFLARFRLRQLLRLHQVRNRIASDLHDDVGSALSSLVLYSDLLSRQDLSDEKQEQIASKIRETAHDSVESMRDIVWSIKSTNDEFEVTQKYMQRIALDLVEPAGIGFSMETDPSLNALKLPMEVRKNLFLIFKEAINNARKYSQAQGIRVVLSRDAGHLVMHVEDDGVGFDLKSVRTDTAPKGGNGIPNMQKRAMELDAALDIQSSQGQGTRITLRIPLGHR
ncbi:MAG: ATP-binding protein [Flavobacteriales bacterium]